MDKKLLKSLANYVAHVDNVVSAMADSHFWNGDENKAVKLMQAARRDLQEQLTAAAEKPEPAAPPATVATA